MFSLSCRNPSLLYIVVILIYIVLCSSCISSSLIFNIIIIFFIIFFSSLSFFQKAFFLIRYFFLISIDRKRIAVLINIHAFFGFRGLVFRKVERIVFRFILAAEKFGGEFIVLNKYIRVLFFDALHWDPRDKWKNSFSILFPFTFAKYLAVFLISLASDDPLDFVSIRPAAQLVQLLSPLFSQLNGLKSKQLLIINLLFLQLGLKFFYHRLTFAQIFNYLPCIFFREFLPPDQIFYKRGSLCIRNSFRKNLNWCTYLCFSKVFHFKFDIVFNYMKLKLIFDTLLLYNYYHKYSGVS